MLMHSLERVKLLQKNILFVLYIFRIVFSLFFIMNLIFWAKGSSAAVPFSTLVAILALWFGISVPLTFVGSYFGFRKRVKMHLLKNISTELAEYHFGMKLFQAIEHPVRTNQIPRQIPEQSFYTQAIPGVIMGGVLPFGCIFIQLFFILNSLWYVLVLVSNVLKLRI